MKDSNANLNSKSLESLYLKKDFDGAKKHILQHRDKFDLGQFHYNLGTLHAKNKEFAISRFHLEKAVKEGYINTKSYHNLDVLKKILKVEDAGTSSHFWEKFLATSKEIPAGAYLTMTLLLFLLLGVAVRFRLVIKKWIIFPLLLLLLLPISFNFFYLKSIDVAIVLQEAQLREGPSKIYSESSIIGAGTKVITGERNGDWIFIKAPLQYAGWAHRDTLGFL